MNSKHQNFRPTAFLKHPMVQTVLASLPLRARGRHPMQDAAREMIFTTAAGVRLFGVYSPQPVGRSRGVVILIHGWEGSSGSRYVLSAGRRLFEKGFDIFRLNLRDHGKSHRLNKGLFWATNLDEVFEVVAQAACLSDRGPAFLAGFSLGGNFALRIAARCTDTPMANLRHVVAVSPALDPSEATDRVDANPMILAYFLKKWRRSVVTKGALYPADYDFTRMLALKNIRQMTAAAVEDYGLHPTIEEYFQGYTITAQLFGRIQVPTTVITAADDPIIPVEDFYALPPNPAVDLIVHPHGGHNGFIEDLRLAAWHERYMVERFSDW
ncbi:MAG: alpha/beta fold hydrolase [Desulfobacterales bacterium]|nr:alpha/beta fold hydrolase [Desulfobacterales bacterium]